MENASQQNTDAHILMLCDDLKQIVYFSYLNSNAISPTTFTPEQLMDAQDRNLLFLCIRG